MLKRTKGRFLLTLLVITGLAGTLKNATLTQPERKFAVNHLKETKDKFLQSVKGLSAAQLNFKGHEGRSIKACIDQLALTEKNLWSLLEASLKAPATTESHPGLEITDEELVTIAATQLKAPETSHKHNWKSTAEAVSAFKAQRTEHIKYARSTTEDLRNHFIQLPGQQLDAYQFLLFVSAYCTRYIREIDAIKKEPGFPKH